MMINIEKLIKGMSLEDLSCLCQDLGHANYRGEQVFRWLYKHRKDGFNETSNLPLDLVNKLKGYEVQTLKLEKKSISDSKNTIKLLFKTIDSMYIETVSMVEGDRHTVCISSQIGCSVDCKFCATGKMGIKRNLHAGEIIDQIIYVLDNINHEITNIVYMGMGEPFLNYKNVIKSADIFSHPKAFNFSKKRITISTAGILPSLKKFINDKHKYKLAISLNASNNQSRRQLMPINNKWPIEDLINIAIDYNKLYKSKITFEYVLIKNINDSEKNAIELRKILSNIECKINIIPYNDINSEFERPSDEIINNFIKVLIKKHTRYQVLVRWSKGQDIEAGCGQLATLSE